MYGYESWTIKKAGMQIRKQPLELDMEQQTGSKKEKECQGWLFNLYANYIMRNAGLEEAQAGIPGEVSITSDMQMMPPLWQKMKKT